MGCDIHGVVERRSGDKWVGVRVLGFVHRSGQADEPYGFVGDVARSRNYRRFAALAGVRGHGPEARGVPPDISDTSKLLIDQWGGDGHSHSWLPLSEAIAIFASTEYWPENVKEGDWPRADPASLFFDVESDKVEEHRLVFWFDN